MKNRFNILAVLATLAMLPSILHAASGTWTNSAGSGNWSAAVNWQGGVIPSGSDTTATFTTTNLTNAVTLDVPATVGNLVFTEVGPFKTNYNNWYLVGNNTLTFQDTLGNPNISVGTNTTIIGVPLSASAMVTLTNMLGTHGGYNWALTNQNNSLAGGVVIQAAQGTFYTTSANSVPSLGGGSGTIYIGAYVGSGQSGVNVTAPNPTGSLTNANGLPSIVIPNPIVNQCQRWIWDQSASVGNEQPANFTGSVYLNSGTAGPRDIYPFQALELSGVVSGGGTYGLILNGGAPLLLYNSGNSFSGNITYSAANTLAVTSDGALGFSANVLNFTTAGGVLRADASFTTARNFNLATTATINVQTNVLEIDNNFGTSLHGAGGLTVNGVNNGILNFGGLYNGGELLLTGANPFTGAITVNGGTLVNGPGSSLSSINGATVASNAAWVCDSVSIPAVPSIAIRQGGLVIFSNSAPGVSSALALTDNGTLDVSAVSGGFTLVSGQSLIGSGGVAGPLMLASGAFISPGTIGGAGTLSITNNLALNGQQIQFDLSTNLTEGGGTNDEIVVTGNLTLGGGETILLNYLNGSLAAGTYKLVKIGGSLSGAFALATTYPNVTLDNGVTTPGYVTLIVTGGGSSAPALFWQGDGLANAWDISTTANWVTSFGGSTVDYSDPSKVTFNDFGSNNVPVTLNVTALPGQVTFNITNYAYTLAGSGNIHGPTSVTINGGNAVTNLLQSDYAGGTVLNNGSKLVLGNGGTTGLAGSGTINLVTNGQLIVNESGPVTFSQVVTGVAAGTPKIVQNGSGTTTLAGIADNSNLGAVVNNGTLALDKISSGAVHSLASATVNTGGTLQLSGVGGSQINPANSVTMAGGNFDMNNQSQTLASLNGYGNIFDSTGAGTLTLTAANGMNVSGGTMNFKTISSTFSAAAGQFLVTGGSTLNLQSGSITLGSVAGSDVQSNAVLNMSGGTLATSTYFAIGSGGTASPPAIANFSGGTFKNTGEFLQGFQGNANVSISGSAFWTLNLFSYGNTGYTLTNYLNGGEIQCNAFNQRGTGLTVWFFNGVTIQALSNAGTTSPGGFFPGETTYGTFKSSPASQFAYISTNGFTMDCQAYNVAIQQNLLHDPSLGAGLDGGLTKLGTGTLTLAGTNSFNGSLTNAAGTLVFNNNGSYNNVFIGDNAVNQVNLVAAGTSLTNNTLTVGVSGSGTQTLNFNLGTAGTPTVPLMVVKGAVNNNGNVVVALLAPVLTPGTIPLLRYGSLNAANFASTWSVSPYPYVSLTLTNDTAHNLVSIIVVPGVTPKWKGNLSSEWDTTTLNWASNSVPTTYLEATPPGEPVTFDDTAVNFTVDISAGTVNPLFINMTNSSHDYTLTGFAGIGGTGALIKSGAGALVLSNTPGANTYSGITTVSGGSVLAQQANVLSPNSVMTFNNSVLNLSNNNQSFASITLNNTPLLGTGTLSGATASSVLTFHEGSSNLVLGVALAGTLSLNQSSATELVLTNPGTLLGPVNINSGTIRMQNGNALGSAGGFSVNNGVNIQTGGRLILDGSFTAPKGINLNGAGPDGAGCLMVTNGNVIVNGAPCQVFDGSVIYVAAGSSVDFQGWSGTLPNLATLYAGGGYTKTGPGDLLVGGVAGNTSSATPVVVQQGRLIATNGCLTAGFITVDSGAGLAGTGPYSGGINVLAGGNLAPNMYGTITTMTVSAVLTNAGVITLQISKNSTVTNADQLNCTGTFVNIGTVMVTTNAGSTLPLAAGDTFRLFTLTNYAVLTGLTPILPALPSGLGWSNNLAVNGTVAVVATVSTLPFAVGASVSGSQLTLSWPVDHTGWRLQVQTNSLSAGLTVNNANWFDVPGSTSVDTEIINIDPAQDTVFYRMVYP